MAETNATLNITNVQKTDEGTYTVTVINSAGMDSGSALLTVLEPPIIVNLPQNVTVKVGQSVSFEVAVTGTAPLSYQWRKNGAILAGQTEKTMNLASVQTGDTGTYEVIVSNLGGTATNEIARLQVMIPPAIALQPKSQHATEGTKVIFEAFVTGDTPLFFQWFKDYQALASQNSATLTFNKVTGSDAGTYYYIVTNQVGYKQSDMVSLAVDTNALPTIIGMPITVDATNGFLTTVKFNVSDDKTPVENLEVVAKCNDTNLLSEGNIAVTNQAGQITLSLRPTGSGTNTVEVTVQDDNGGIKKQSFLLNVLDPILVAQDGYIAGALVFFDANNNGVLDAGEPQTITDSQGQFKLKTPLEVYDLNKNGIIDPSEGKLVMQGGIDVATGMQIKTTMTAPAGSTVINPITTVLMAMTVQQPGLTLDQAETAVKQALNLSPDIQLGSYDPFKAAMNNDPNAASVLAASAMFQDTTIQISAMVDAASNVTQDQAANSVSSALAARIAAGNSIDLTQAGVVQSLVADSVLLAAGATGEEIKMETTLVQGAAQMISEINQVKQDIANSTNSTAQIVSDISQAQVVGQISVADDLARVASGQKQIDDVLMAKTGQQLSQLLEDAPVGTMTGLDTRLGTVEFGAADGRVTENGVVLKPIVVSRKDGSSGSLAVIIKLTPGTATAGTNYNPADIRVEFANREIYKEVDLSKTVLNDFAPQGEHTVRLELSLATPIPDGAALGSNTNALLVIEDVQTSGTFAFGADSFSVREDGTRIESINVMRTGGGDGEVQLIVEPVAIPGGAKPDINYVSNPVIVTFKANNYAQQVTVPVIADHKFTGDLKVGLRLKLANNAPANAFCGPLTNATLTIVDQDIIPLIVTQPQGPSGGQPVMAGTLLKLAVAATGAEPLNYQWLKDGVALQGQSRPALVIASVAASDAGVYSVKVSNAAGSVSSDPVAITVIEGPSFVTLPQSQTVLAGSEVSFKAYGIGTAPLMYQWFKQGVAIANETNLLLRLTNVKDSDSGKYSVKIANNAGSITSAEAVLTVLNPPAIQKQPESRWSNPGETVQFSVEASGTAPFTYQWFKDGMALASGTNSILVVTNVQPLDAGDYAVVVMNQAGSATSMAGSLALRVKPAIEKEPQDQHVVESMEVVFAAKATGTKPLFYQWQKEGQVLIGETNEMLTLSAVKSTDAGQYRVVVSNAAGSQTSRTAKLDVVLHPSILTQPQSVNVLRGSPVNFSVAASGTGPLTYQWLKNGVALAGQTLAALSISAASESDAGIYMVIVSNEAGSIASFDAVLSIMLPPTFVLQPQGGEIRTGTEVSMSVAMQGSAPMNYQWYKNGVLLAGETGTSLSIKKSQINDSGSYTVRVVNPAGNATSKPAILSVTDPLVIVAQPTDKTVYEQANAVFSVYATGSGTLEYQWFKDGVSIPGQTTMNLVLAKVTTNQAGSYFVRINDEKESTDSRSVRLVVNKVNIVINDLFAKRIAVEGTRASISGSNVGATAETGEPAHAGSAGRASVWWSWRAPTTGMVTMDTFGSDFDTVLAVYTGSTIQELKPVASNDDAPSGAQQTSLVSFKAEGGVNYAIAVDSYSAIAGNIVLNLNLPMPSPVFGVFQRTANHGFSANLVGESGIQYTIQASSDLIHWVNLTNLSSPDGTMTFEDASTTNKARFYRAMQTQIH